MNRSGFSFIDIVIAVLIVGMMASFAVGRTADLKAKLAVRGGINAFHAAHNLARSVAVRSSRVAELRIDTDSEMLWVQVDTTFARTGVMDTIGEVAQFSEFGVDIKSTRSVLCFDARGIASAQGSCDDTQSAVVIFARGADADTVRRSALGMLAR